MIPVVGKPAIVTLLLVPCIPWFGWNTLTTPDPLVVLNAFVFNVLLGKVSFDKVNTPVTFSNSALLILNFISSFWSAVQVDPFWDLKNTPVYGCWDIVLSEPILVSPNLATYAV